MEFIDNHEDVRYNPGVGRGYIMLFADIKEFHFTRHVPAIASERPERRWWIKGIKVSEWWLRAKVAASDPASSSCAGRDTRNALWGRNPVATSLKPPHSASSREVATPDASSRADSMERPHLPEACPNAGGCWHPAWSFTRTISSPFRNPGRRLNRGASFFLGEKRSIFGA